MVKDLDPSSYIGVNGQRPFLTPLRTFEEDSQTVSNVTLGKIARLMNGQRLAPLWVDQEG